MVEAASSRSSAVVVVPHWALGVVAGASSYGFAGQVVIVRVAAEVGHTLPALPHAAALVDTLAYSVLPASLADMSCSGWFVVLSRL